MKLTITTLCFDNRLPKNDQCRPKHVGVPNVHKPSSVYCCAVARTKAVNHISARNMGNGSLRCFMNVSAAV